MARVKRGVTARAKHKKVLKKAKGYYGAKSRQFRSAKEQVIKSGQYAYRDRRVKKREFRSLWIVRIGAASKELGLSYNRFINGLSQGRCGARSQGPRGHGDPRQACIWRAGGPGESHTRHRRLSKPSYCCLQRGTALAAPLFCFRSPG